MTVRRFLQPFWRCVARPACAAGAAALVSVVLPSPAAAVPQGQVESRPGPAGPHAPAPQPAPPVDALVEQALARAPSLAARRARLEAARAALPAAGALPDPMIDVEYRSAGFPRYTIGSDPMSMAGASVRQPLLSGGRRRASRAVAAAGVAAREAEAEAVARSLAADVRVQYARLFALDRERETLRDAGEVVDMLEATARARYASGESDQAGILRAQLEASRLLERLDDVAAERAAEQATLNRLLDRPAGTPIGVVTVLPDAGPPPIANVRSLPDEAATSAPEVTVREAEVGAARERVSAARAELAPSWSVGAGFFWQGGFDRVVNVSVGVELPFWKARKQQPLIAASERELEAARHALGDTRAGVRAEAERLLIAWANADAQMTRYREGILPQSSAAFDAARASFLGSRSDFPGVLDEFRRWIEVRVQLARREADRFAARARLEALTEGQEGQVGREGVVPTPDTIKEPRP